MKKISTLLLAAAMGLSSMAATRYGDGQHVIYEMNVGMFTNNGTLSAAQQQLASLQDLGVDVIWLMPIYPRGNSGSPYAAKNFQQVNSRYGTLSDLKNFVNAAHNLGMQVWLDWVPNHMATEADWLSNHPEYFKKDNNGNMIHPNGYMDVWQLDYGNSGLKTAMNNCLKYWIDQADIDGYRCDYVSSGYIPESYWSSTISEIKNYKSGKNITFLGEVDLTDGNNQRLRNKGFDYDYAWGFQETSLYRDFGANGTSATDIKNSVNSLKTLYGNSRMVYLTNHDQNFNDGGKTLTTMYGDNRYPLTVLQFTAWGMPLIYNGQECGGNQILNYFQDTKIDWTAKDDKMKNTLKVLSKMKHEVEAFRDGNTTAANGSLTWLNVSGTNSDKVVAYKRTYNGSEAVVVINFATSAVNVTVNGITAGNYAQWLDSKTIASTTAQTSVALAASQSFNLNAKGYAVYVKGQAQQPAGNFIDPAKLTVAEGTTTVFYESPDRADICAWMWDYRADGTLFCNNGWPGDALTLLGQTANGSYVYQLTVTKTSDVPTSIIFTKNGGDDANKTFTGDFVNHGYYVETASQMQFTVPVAQPAVARPDNVSVTLADYGQATFSSAYDLDFSNSPVRAYMASGYNADNGALLLTRVYEVPAGTGLLLKGAKGDWQIPVAERTSWAYRNMFAAVVESRTVSASEDGYVNYILSNTDSNGVGFYRIAGSVGVNANHAYLRIPSSLFAGNAARVITLQFDDDVTAIVDVQSDALQKHARYNLQGQRMKASAKGLFVVDGKKVVVK